jgi:hypothetical protein
MESLNSHSQLSDSDSKRMSDFRIRAGCLSGKDSSGTASSENGSSVVSAEIPQWDFLSLEKQSGDLQAKAAKRIRKKEDVDASMIPWLARWQHNRKLGKIQGLYDKLVPQLKDTEEDIRLWVTALAERKHEAFVGGEMLRDEMDCSIAKLEAEIDSLDDLSNDCRQINYDISREITELEVAMVFNSENLKSKSGHTKPPSRRHSKHQHHKGKSGKGHGHGRSRERGHSSSDTGIKTGTGKSQEKGKMSSEAVAAPSGAVSEGCSPLKLSRDNSRESIDSLGEDMLQEPHSDHNEPCIGRREAEIESVGKQSAVPRVDEQNACMSRTESPDNAPDVHAIPHEPAVWHGYRGLGWKGAVTTLLPLAPGICDPAVPGGSPVSLMKKSAQGAILADDAAIRRPSVLPAADGTVLRERNASTGTLKGEVPESTSSILLRSSSVEDCVMRDEIESESQVMTSIRNLQIETGGIPTEAAMMSSPPLSSPLRSRSSSSKGRRSRSNSETEVAAGWEIPKISASPTSRAAEDSKHFLFPDAPPNASGSAVGTGTVLADIDVPISPVIKPAVPAKEVTSHGGNAKKMALSIDCQSNASCNGGRISPESQEEVEVEEKIWLDPTAKRQALSSKSVSLKDLAVVKSMKQSSSNDSISSLNGGSTSGSTCPSSAANATDSKPRKSSSLSDMVKTAQKLAHKAEHMAIEKLSHHRGQRLETTSTCAAPAFGHEKGSAEFYANRSNESTSSLSSCKRTDRFTEILNDQNFDVDHVELTASIDPLLMRDTDHGDLCARVRQLADVKAALPDMLCSLKRDRDHASGLLKKTKRLRLEMVQILQPSPEEGYNRSSSMATGDSPQRALNGILSLLHIGGHHGVEKTNLSRQSSKGSEKGTIKTASHTSFSSRSDFTPTKRSSLETLRSYLPLGDHSHHSHHHWHPEETKEPTASSCNGLNLSLHPILENRNAGRTLSPDMDGVPRVSSSMKMTPGSGKNTSSGAHHFPLGGVLRTRSGSMIDTAAAMAMDTSMDSSIRSYTAREALTSNKEVFLRDSSASKCTQITSPISSGRRSEVHSSVRNSGLCSETLSNQCITELRVLVDEERKAKQQLSRITCLRESTEGVGKKVCNYISAKSLVLFSEFLFAMYIQMTHLRYCLLSILCSFRLAIPCLRRARLRGDRVG